MKQERTCIIFSKKASQIASKLPSNLDRSTVVHELISSYGMFDRLSIISPHAASRQELEQFHDEDYLDCLFGPADKSQDELEDAGLLDDCPIFEHLADYVQFTAGGTIDAAHALISGTFQHALNWDGGRHHAHCDSAAGFCYVNDVVLGILTLRKRFQRILYLDVDLHHGDGVEEAFAHSDSVLTFSMHRHDVGFYPGTGGNFDCGVGWGSGKALNLPLEEGLADDTFMRICDTIIPHLVSQYKPEAVVIVAGTDGLANDPLKQWNLTDQSFVHLVDLIKGFNIPALWLGGGGYNTTDAARCWTAITARLLGISVAEDIPDCNSHFELYAPSFSLSVDRNNRQDMNAQNIDDKMRLLISTFNNKEQ